MVFFFVGYLFTVILWLIPIKVSALGFWENENGKRNFSLKVSFYEKTFAKRDDKAAELPKKKSKIFKRNFLKNFKPSDIPFDALQKLDLSVVLPENKHEGAAIVFSMLSALTYPLPVKISLYRGKKTYWEIFAKASFSLYDIIPVLLRKLIKGDNNKWK